MCARNSHARSLRSTRDGDRRRRLSAAHVVSGKAYSSCAFCNDDKTQPGCECFETGYHVAITSPPAAVWGDDHSGDGSGEDTHDESGGISTNWRSLPLDCGGDDQGDESGGMSYPCR